MFAKYLLSPLKICFVESRRENSCSNGGSGTGRENGNEAGKEVEGEVIDGI